MSENDEDLFEYNENWDSKNLAPELVLTNYNYKEPCYLLLHPFIFRENHFFEDF